MTDRSLNLLLMSTPVGTLGSGIGGGVELTLFNLAQSLQQRGHQIQVVAPTHSILPGIPIEEIPGHLQIPAQTQTPQDPIILPANSVLGNMWEYARSVQTEYDLIVNFAYDWLPLYLTPFFEKPIAHFISMGALTLAMNEVIAKVHQQFPQTLGFYTRTQAATFGIDHPRTLQSGLDLSLYEFCETPGTELAWVGRIAPEKGLEDAVAAATQMGIPLKILGKLQDQNYWQQICQQFPDTILDYRGFLSTANLQRELRECRALIMTPRWVEAFGNVAIEALACGVPVISYHRGGPSEIIEPGKTGFLVEPDSISGLVSAIEQLDTLDRWQCRQTAETRYSLPAMGASFEQWFYDILKV